MDIMTGMFRYGFCPLFIHLTLCTVPFLLSESPHATHKMARSYGMFFGGAWLFWALVKNIFEASDATLYSKYIRSRYIFMTMFFAFFVSFYGPILYLDHAFKGVMENYYCSVAGRRLSSVATDADVQAAMKAAADEDLRETATAPQDSE